jgi:hypothetical protein
MSFHLSIYFHHLKKTTLNDGQSQIDNVSSLGNFGANFKLAIIIESAK